MEVSPDFRPSTSFQPDTATKSRINSDFDTFLRMLTAQMKNQDPLNPVEATDFATQLATFSGVEQAVMTNDLLRALSAQMQVTGLANVSSWIGNEVRAAAPAYFDGNPLTLHPNPIVFANSTEVVVRDSDGFLVQRFGIPATTNPVQWDGVGPDGRLLPQGTYSFTLVSSADGNQMGETTMETYSKVTEVRSQNGQMELVMKGGVTISANDVTGLRQAQP